MTDTINFLADWLWVIVVALFFFIVLSSVLRQYVSGANMSTWSWEKKFVVLVLFLINLISLLALSACATVGIVVEIARCIT